MVLPALLALAEADVASAVERWAGDQGAVTESRALPDLGDWLSAFQRLQAWEAWRDRGAWLTGRMETLGDDVRARFEVASRITEGEAEQAREVLVAARSVIRDLVGERVLVLPSASSVAPAVGPRLAENLQSVRDATMRLTCLAGVGGLPAVGVPLATRDALPCGVCLVAAPGRDRDLLDLATRLAPAASTTDA